MLFWKVASVFGVVWGSSLTAVVDGAEAVRNKHAGSLLLFQDGVDIAEQRLFRVRIKCGGLHSYQSAVAIRISEVGNAQLHQRTEEAGPSK